MQRRAWIRGMAAGLGGLVIQTAGAQPASGTLAGWPGKPVHLIVPTPGGSSLDVIARLLGERLKDRWGQPVVIDNKPGAGGLIGLDAVAKAAPDGTTLGIGFNGPIAFGPALYKRMPYDPARDLIAIVQTTSQPNVLAVASAVPVHDVAGFVAWARQQPQGVSYGSVGNGSSSHLTMELFRSRAGFEAVHVPYNGSPAAGASLAGGETQALFSTAPALLPLVQSGRVRLLAVTSLTRTDTHPDLPTIAESGYAGFEALAWNGLFAPAGTPAEVVQRIHDDVAQLLHDGALRESLAKQGLAAGGGSSAAFRATIERDSQTWGALIRRLGISLD